MALFILEDKVKARFTSVYFSITCPSCDGRCIQLMLWRAFSSAYPWWKLRLSCCVSGKWPRLLKRENREQKDMSGVYTTVLLADNVTPLWMCALLKTLILKNYFFYYALNKRFFPHINRSFSSIKSCSVNSKLSLGSICFVYWRLSAGRISVVTLYGCQWNDQNSSF